MYQKEQYDVVICGAGVNGLVAAHKLSEKRDLRILILEECEPLHPYGGSYGETRLLRRSYFENGLFIEYVNRSLPYWRSLNKSSPVPLFHQTEMIFAETETPVFMEQLKKETSSYSVPLKELSPELCKSTYPFLKITQEALVIVEEDVLVFFLSKIIKKLKKDLSEKKGITYKEKTKVLSIGHGGEVRTKDHLYFGHKILASLGGWLPSLFPDLSLPITLHSSPQYWFREKEGSKIKKITHPFLISYGENIFFGFPDYGSGVKMASYCLGEKIQNPYERSLETTAFLPLFQEVISSCLPSLDTKAIKSHLCFFDMTSTEEIYLEHHPKDKNIILWGGSSGHALKMAPYFADKAISLMRL